MEKPKQGANRGNAGKGRPKGSLNKTTTALKEAILSAAENVGNEMNPGSGSTGYLEFLAKDQPSAFATLLGKVLPMQVAGDPDNPLRVVTKIELVAARGNSSD